MSLGAFAGVSKTCKIELMGGKRVQLTFRPFTLADLAWLQNEFNDEQDALDIAALKSTPICKIIWHQLTIESQSFFSDITFEQLNPETEEPETIRLVGYEKLLHSFKDNENMLEAFTCYSEVKGINNFMPDEKKKRRQRAQRKRS